ncbi:hypothetical protein CEXT_526281 [Caerostris extrusa]|uniref:Uncharacterized protein n=1 Tax=Caerostris extrusa TaxID=172846 RepID=A0AAV4WGE7_CAEEX|nr:hypothetical protein CEXT_526281 [Caerostris extrusa]
MWKENEDMFWDPKYHSWASSFQIVMKQQTGATSMKKTHQSVPRKQKVPVTRKTFFPRVFLSEPRTAAAVT